MSNAPLAAGFPHMRECIELCGACHDKCLTTIQHCLARGGMHAAAPHIRLMEDCVEICQTSRDYMLRGSDLHTHTCRACAAICAVCAVDCEKMAGDDEHMRACGAACRQCAQSCEKMSQHA